MTSIDSALSKQETLLIEAHLPETGGIFRFGPSVVKSAVHSLSDSFETEYLEEIWVTLIAYE